MTKVQKEIWKDITDFKGYQVSNLGQVRSLDRLVKHGTYGDHFLRKVIGKTMIPKNIRGYRAIKLSNDTFSGMKTIHRLVAIEFYPQS